VGEKLETKRKEKNVKKGVLVNWGKIIGACGMRRLKNNVEGVEK